MKSIEFLLLIAAKVILTSDNILDQVLLSNCLLLDLLLLNFQLIIYLFKNIIIYLFKNK